MQEDDESQDQQENTVVHKDIKQLDPEPNGWTKSLCCVKKEEEWDTGKEEISFSLEIEPLPPHQWGVQQFIRTNSPAAFSSGRCNNNEKLKVLLSA